MKPRTLLETIKENSMSHIAIHDLARNEELDGKSMSSVRGGNSWLKALGPVANVNVDVNQNITQF
ncbi:MAG TPA: hypothetical protein VGE12_03875, partial [Noviherbaspirillum sp.]